MTHVRHRPRRSYPAATSARRLAAFAVLLLGAGCARVPGFVPGEPPARDEAAATRDERDDRAPRARNEAASRDARRARASEAEAERRAVADRARARDAVPRSPLDVAPARGEAARVWDRAVRAPGTRIIVSVRARALWLMRDTVTVFRAPVAVGMNDGFTYGGRDYHFATPVGVRKVIAKSPDPLWVPPDWHYFEKVVQRGLEPVHLQAGRTYALDDGSHIEIRDDQVGRVNHFGNFAPFTPGNEIIFDGRIFIPPFGTAQRRIPLVLGTHKLEIGDGFLIHGTDQPTSIGDAVSHGCVRMYNEDVATLYEQAPVGTAVYLF
jgi:L,D-transpeptidase catalytic domain